MEDWQRGPSVLLSKEHRRQHYYFGGFCDGFYLSFRGSWIRVWGWEKPSQFEVEEYIRIDQEERRGQ